MLDIGELLFKLSFFGLIYREVLLTRKVRHRDIVADRRRAMVFFHNRTADTASHAGRHLNKALMYLSVLDIPQRGNTVFNPVKGYVGISGYILSHRFQHSARGGEEARAAFGIIGYVFLKRDVLALKPMRELLKCEDGVHDTRIMLSLVLFSDARTDKYRFRVWNTLFDICAMSLHRRHNVSQIFQLCGIIFLYKKIYRVTAGGDDDISVLLAKHTLVLVFNDGSADSGFLHVSKPKLLQRVAHRLYSNALVVCDKGGGKTDDNRISALEQYAHLFGFVNYFLCVLGTHHEAVTAQNTLVADNVSLISRKADRLNGAMADTFIAVFTVGFFECQTIWHMPHILSVSIGFSMFSLKKSLKFSLLMPTKTSSFTCTVTPEVVHLPIQKLPASTTSSSIRCSWTALCISSIISLEPLIWQELPTQI